jgi:hypothetical protein
MQLGAPAGFHLAVDPHPAGIDFGVRLTSRVTQARRLQQLIELDMLATNFNRNRHFESTKSGLLIKP